VSSTSAHLEHPLASTHLDHGAALLALLLAFLGLAPAQSAAASGWPGSKRQRASQQERRLAWRRPSAGHSDLRLPPPNSSAASPSKSLGARAAAAASRRPPQFCCIALHGCWRTPLRGTHLSPLTIAMRVSVCSPLSCFFLGGMAAAPRRVSSLAIINEQSCLKCETGFSQGPAAVKATPKVLGEG
jgi:hypothetical protein